MKEFWRFIKFVLFSISAGVIEIVSFTLLSEFTPLKEWICYIISVVLSVIWNFTFNRKFTFKSANNIPVAMLKVGLFYVVFIPLTALLEKFLTEDLLWPGLLATAINMVLNFVLEFFYQRYFVFGKSLDSNIKVQEETKSNEDSCNTNEK
ncbi:MAG: GtrA family protein [Bacilli bacterium]